MAAAMDQNFIRQMQKKVEEELARKEKDVLTYWRLELEKVLTRRHMDLASQTSALKELLARMEKRISMV